MRIQKRSLPVFILLNCLTLGVYGFVVSKQIGEEVNVICKGDGEKPAMGYAQAMLIRAIPTFLGFLVGLILGCGGANVVSFLEVPYLALYDGTTFAMVLICMLACGLCGYVLGTTISSIYMNYWWYKQANRLKLNAYRYGLTVNEGGLDNFLFRTVFNVLFVPITAIMTILSFVAPMLIVFLMCLMGEAGVIVGIILLVLFVAVYLIFGAEISVGANFGMMLMIKNLNRYADVYSSGAAPFDPMGYEYYPAVGSKYPNFVPGVIGGAVVNPISDTPVEDYDNTDTIARNCGQLIGIKGSCAGYGFELASGEVIIIGKDAKMSSVVIDPAYKEVSRKHVSVCYDMISDSYKVTDFSSNGTWANGEKLVNGQTVSLPRGTELKLANGKNIFQLG